MDYKNPWKFKGTSVTDATAADCTGFVYLITNKATGRKYIGKKLFWFTKTKTKTIKGKKKKVREKISSDWKEYYGSNNELKADIEKLGTSKFKREVLYLCKTKGECTYYEAREQFLRDVLLTDSYYNGWIHCKVSISHLPKERLKTC